MLVTATLYGLLLDGVNGLLEWLLLASGRPKEVNVDGVNTSIEFNCGEVVTGVGSIPLALAAHAKKCNCEGDN